MNSMEQALALVESGRAQRNAGNVARARDLYAEAVALFRKCGNPLRLAHTIRHVADMDRELGNVEASEPAYREAMAIYRANPDAVPLDVANMLNGFANLLAAKGEREEARLLTREARAIYANLGIEPGVAECTQRLSRL